MDGITNGSIYYDDVEKKRSILNSGCENRQVRTEYLGTFSSIVD